jgi:6-phosphofructokinase
MPARGTIGNLTGGGDVPGLYPVIQSVVYRAREMGRVVIGIREGWKGLTHMNIAEHDDPFERRTEIWRTRTFYKNRKGRGNLKFNSPKA